MKYLKTYEDHYDLTYDVGDYVLVYGERFKENYNPSREDIKFKIIEVDYSDHNTPYLLISADGMDLWVPENKWIKRKMTPEEIEEYELKVGANKYNL